MPPLTGRRAHPWRSRRRGILRGVGLAGDTTTEALGPFQTFPVGPDGTPGTLGIEVYISPGSDPLADPTTYAWTRITPWVLYEDKIRIKRGLEDEQSLVGPSTCELNLKNYAIPDPPADVAAYNIDALFTERNPYGPWFGRLGPNTPLRVDVNIGLGAVRRYTGFVIAWPPASSREGNFRFVKIAAAGVLRRIGQGDSPISSRATGYIRTGMIESHVERTPVNAWWPLEESSGTGSPGSGLSDGTPLTVTGTIAFGAVTPPAGVLAAPDLSACALDAFVPLSAVNGTVGLFQWQTGCYFNATGDGEIMFWDCVDGVSWVSLRIISGQLALLDSAGNAVTATGISPAINYADGEWHMARVGLTYISPGAYSLALAGDSINLSTDSGFVATTVGYSPISRIYINRLVSSNIQSVTHANTTGASATTSGNSSNNNTDAMNGSPGLTTAATWTLIMDSANLYSTSRNISSGDLNTMGTYPVGGLRQALDGVVAAEQGWMYERTSGRLGFDAHTWRENRETTIHLNNGEGYRQLTSFNPVPDDQLIRNVATVTRLNGSFRTITETEGRRGTAAVGPVERAETLNLFTDDDALQAAAAWISRGTVDEERYPRVEFELHRAINAAVAVEWLGNGGDAARGSEGLGRRMTIENPSPDLPPGNIDLTIIGYVEEFDQFTYRVDAVCVPFAPFRTARAADEHDDENEFVGYAVPDSCVLAEDLDSTEVEVDVTSTPLWSTDAADWALGPVVVVDGEDMRLYGVAGASNPQTLTVVRSTNGIVLTHAAGAELDFKYPGIAGL